MNSHPPGTGAHARCMAMQQRHEVSVDIWKMTTDLERLEAHIADGCEDLEEHYKERCELMTQLARAKHFLDRLEVRHNLEMN